MPDVGALIDADFDSDLRRGIALFDQRHYWEAHEAWEDRWRVETGERRRLLHGLIQVAAAFVKLCAHNPRGTVQLLEKARRKLASLPVALHGVDVAAVRALADQWHAAAAALVAAGRTDFDPAALPPLPRAPRRGASH